MAEAIISPGVFLNENDLSIIEQGPVAVGAAIIGPTVKGPVYRPTVVTSYSDFTNRFGSIFITGSSTEEFMTSIAVYSYFQQGGESLIVTRAVSGSTTANPTAGYAPATASIAATGSGTSFVLETISAGVNQSNDAGASTAVGSYLPSGSINNVRWEIVSADKSKGLFTLLIRRGDDSPANKLVLETWSNLSMDPTSPNYIEYQIGNMVTTPYQDENGDWNLRVTGSYANKSRYVRVKSATAQPTYFLNSGAVNPAASGSMPTIGSGSLNGAFGGGLGDEFGGASSSVALRLFENIGTGATAAQNIQGLIPSDYNVAISLIKNKDWYDYQVVYVPGLTYTNAVSTLDTLINNTDDRGDAVVVIDPVGYGSNTTAAVNAVSAIDNNYVAAYWPWVSVRSYDTGKVRNVPASLIVPGAYAYSDKVSAEWFAPAGLNRGSLSTVLSPEVRLSRANRDTLYNGRINPIAIFPGAGTVIYGQKNLQAKPSALDRINVRRLLIQLKREIGKIAENFLFEQNNATTRAKFVNQVTPYLDTVQQQQGLYSYRVVMDETNNTPDVIDRQQLVGAIYLQPTKTVEFIILDFNVLPTGATFGK